MMEASVMEGMERVRVTNISLTSIIDLPRRPGGDR
jgi:hypothetical protein